MGLEIAPRQGAILGVNVECSIVTIGTLLRSCVKVCKAIELLFRLLSGVDPWIGVLDGVHIHQGKGEVLEAILVHWF